MSHTALTALFRELERKRICWCIIRLPSEQAQSGDVDLLVDRGDVARLRSVLANHAFAQLPGWTDGLHFVRYLDATDQWTWLHVVTEIAFGRYYMLKTGAEAECLRRRQRDGIATLLAPDDAFWILLLHCLLDNGEIAPRHRAQLHERAGNVGLCGSPLARLVAATCPHAWEPDKIVAYVRTEKWEHLERLGLALAEAWMRRDHIGPLRFIAHRTVQLGVRLHAFRRSRGLGVALLGPDGAGKSTLAQGIQETFLLPVRPVYMGLTGGLLPWIDALRVPPYVIFGRLLVLWVRYFAAQYHQARGRLVIFDRYTYDAYVPTPYRLNWLRRAYRWIDGHACPAPDLILVLSAPGQVMHERKGEYTPEMLEDWRRHFLSLQRRVEGLEVVDTTRSKESVRSDVVNRIWRRYRKRWGE